MYYSLVPTMTPGWEGIGMFNVRSPPPNRQTNIQGFYIQFKYELQCIYSSPRKGLYTTPTLLYRTPDLGHTNLVSTIHTPAVFTEENNKTFHMNSEQNVAACTHDENHVRADPGTVECCLLGEELLTTICQTGGF